MPLKAAEQLLHLAAAGLLAVGAGRWVGSRVLGLVLFALVALDPVHLSAESARVNRPGIYAALTVALLGLALLCASLATRPPRRRTWGLAAVLGVVTGLVTWAFLITRDEQVVVLPALALLLVVTLVRVAGRRPSRWWAARRQTARRLLPALVAVALALGTCLAGLAAVREANDRRYDVAVVTDYTEGAFPRLYSALVAVDSGTPRRFVPVPAQSREAAYAVSPALARLRGSLEAESGPAARWKKTSCGVVDVCDDYAAGWFGWALRDAVTEAVGGERDAVARQELMSAAARQVEAACGRAYPCRSSVSTFLPPLDVVPPDALLDASVGSLRALAAFELGQRDQLDGEPEQWPVFRDTVGGIAADPDDQRAAVSAARDSGWRQAWRGSYVLLVLVGGVPALLGLLLARGPRVRAAQALAVVLLTVVAARVALLALVDVTSFPAARTGYLLPAYDPALAALGLGWWCLALSWRGRRPPG